MELNNTNSTFITYSPLMINPPEPLFMDRVQLALLLILFMVGAPINLISLTKLRSKSSLARCGRLALLRLHLNISDLMVIFIYVTSRACWLLTYQWRGGDLLCKLIMFLNSMSFQLSSNIIVCVALDRLFTVLYGTLFYKRYVIHHPAKYLRICVMISWIVAIGVNISQFFVWVVISPFPRTAPHWKQCTTIFSSQGHFRRLIKLDPTLKDQFYSNSLKLPFQINKFMYNAWHIGTVFWIPAGLILFSYTIVVIRMYQLSAKKKSSVKRMMKSGLGMVGDNGSTQMTNLALAVEMVSLKSGTDGADGRPSISVSPNNRHRTKSSIGELIDEPYQSPEAPPAGTGTSTASSTAYLMPVAIHRMRNKTFRTSLLLVLAYFVCWTPYNFFALWQFFDEVGYSRYAVGMKFLNVLIIFNSVVNPFLYSTLKCKLPCYRNRQE